MNTKQLLAHNIEKGCVRVRVFTITTQDIEIPESNGQNTLLAYTSAKGQMALSYQQNFCIDPSPFTKEALKKVG